MRLESPGDKCNKKREEGQWLIQAAWMLGIGEVMRNLPSDVAAREVEGALFWKPREREQSAVPGLQVKMERCPLDFIAQRLW